MRVDFICSIFIALVAFVSISLSGSKKKKKIAHYFAVYL